MTKYIESKNVQTRLLFSGNIVKQPCFDEIRDTDAYRVVGALENSEFVVNNQQLHESVKILTEEYERSMWIWL